MNIETAIEAVATVENAGGLYYLSFPYVSSVGLTTGPQTVQVPITHPQPTPNDKKALLEAVTVQGGIGHWHRKDDGSVWLTPTADC